MNGTKVTTNYHGETFPGSMRSKEGTFAHAGASQSIQRWQGCPPLTHLGPAGKPIQRGYRTCFIKGSKGHHSSLSVRFTPLRSRSVVQSIKGGKEAPVQKAEFRKSAGLSLLGKRNDSVNSRKTKKVLGKGLSMSKSMNRAAALVNPASGSETLP